MTAIGKSFRRRLRRRSGSQSFFCRPAYRGRKSGISCSFATERLARNAAIPQCRHTPELEHARNFAPAGFTKRTDGVWVEQEGVTMEVKIDQDKLEKRLVEAMREAMGLEGEKRSPHGLALG